MFLKIETDKDYHLTIKDYHGTQEGKFGIQHKWSMFHQGEEVTWTPSQKQHDGITKAKDAGQTEIVVSKTGTGRDTRYSIKDLDNNEYMNYAPRVDGGSLAQELQEIKDRLTALEMSSGAPVDAVSNKTIESTVDSVGEMPF